MSQLNFQRPLDPQAVKRANDIFYYSRPEMLVQGQRQPIRPLDPQHSAYRDEWEYHYLNQGGKIKSHQAFVDTVIHSLIPPDNARPGRILLLLICFIYLMKSAFIP